MFPSIISLHTVNWEKLTKSFINLLALVLAYSVVILIAVTYIPLRISFVLREPYFAYISLIHHRAHIISLSSLQLHYPTFLIKLASVTSLHFNYITCSKLITSPNSRTFYNTIITSLSMYISPLHSINLSSEHTFTDSIIPSFHPFINLYPLASRTISGMLRNYCFFLATSRLTQGRAQLIRIRYFAPYAPRKLIEG